MAVDLSDTKKSDLCLPEELKDKSLAYDSEIWTYHQASDIFIKPTATSGKGSEFTAHPFGFHSLRVFIGVSHILISLVTYLKVKTLAGASKVTAVNKALTEHDSTLENDCKYLSTANAFMSGEEDNESCAEVVQYNTRGINLIRERQALIEPVRTRAQNLFNQFGHISRLCEQIEAMQMSHGEKLVQEPEHIAKLMVAMKCLDASWQTTIPMYKEVLALHEVLSCDLDVQVPGYMIFRRGDDQFRLVRDTSNGPYIIKGWQGEGDVDEDGSGNDGK